MTSVNVHRLWFVSSGALQQAKVNDEPVFVLGHPRTGTSLLHNLLAEDCRFGAPNTFQVGFPSGFLSLERYNWALAGHTLTTFFLALFLALFLTLFLALFLTLFLALFLGSTATSSQQQIFALHTSDHFIRWLLDCRRNRK
jgi:hypothetical protein